VTVDCKHRDEAIRATRELIDNPLATSERITPGTGSDFNAVVGNRLTIAVNLRLR
jgi:hypothetical protein